MDHNLCIIPSWASAGKMIRQPFRRLPVSRCLTLGRVGCAPVCISEIFFLVNGYTASVVVRTRPPRTPFALRESINLWQPYAVTRSALRMRALAGAVVGSKEHEQALVCAARHPEVLKRTGQPWTYDSRFLFHCLVVTSLRHFQQASNSCLAAGKHNPMRPTATREKHRRLPRLHA